jgi:hypothetical protein
MRADPWTEKYRKLKRTNNTRQRVNNIYIPPILYSIDLNTGSGKNLESLVSFSILAFVADFFIDLYQSEVKKGQFY